MEIIKQNSIIVSIDTPWNEKSLQLKSNEIINVTYTTQDQLQILINEYEEKCIKNKVQLSVIRTYDSEIIEKLQRVGYQKCEISLEVFFSFKNFEKHPTKQKTVIVSYDQKYLEEIKTFAYNDFHFGRFLEDFRVEKTKARERTKLWIDDLINNPNVSCLLGLTKENFMGFMFYKIVDNKIELILGGVKSNYAHLTQEFWKEIINKLSYSNAIFTMISASNSSIINLYSELGFKFRKSLIGLHKHRNYDSF